MVEKNILRMRTSLLTSDYKGINQKIPLNIKTSDQGYLFQEFLDNNYDANYDDTNHHKTTLGMYPIPPEMVALGEQKIQVFHTNPRLSYCLGADLHILLLPFLDGTLD